MFQPIVCLACGVKEVEMTDRLVLQVLKKGHYRPAQTSLALRRASQLLRAQKPKKIKAKRGSKPKAD